MSYLSYQQLHLHLELVHVGELRVAGAGHARVHRGHHVLGRVEREPCHQKCYLVAQLLSTTHEVRP